MRSHEVDYRVVGADLQFVEIELDPGESVVAESGAMMYVEEGIVFETRMGDGSEPNRGAWGKLKSAGKRALAGESLFLAHFTNQGSGRRTVAFAASYPGKIVPVDLAAFGGRILAQKTAFLCAAMGTKLGIAFNRKFGAGVFGGEGFILQDIQGDGLAFLHAGGTVVEKRLIGETLRVDTGCIVAFEPQIEYSIERAGRASTMVFGGEGLFLATLRGAGRVWLQSLPFSRLADEVLMRLPPSRDGD
ncbi:MAG: TIGR00266 family protein [bacterium]|nr:TIGR00266 family protein [bacterium]MDE0290841.1 TIGR00266 family protein [bacterium]MDE0438255.1 TIGR00266 family protein [bacterium]